MKLSPNRRPLVAGNWKMFGFKRDLAEVRKLVRSVVAHRPRCDVVICPPATLLAEMRKLGRHGKVKLGGQTCHQARTGAHTGDISAEMLADMGAKYVIVGHSERRANHAETDGVVAAQVAAVWRAGLEPILCIGETAAENESGQTESILKRQIAGSIPQDASLAANRLTMAYEPIWAIGTGRTPTLADIGRMHEVIRETLTERWADHASCVRILYGGSVKPDNAKAILAVPGVDGALVGGASLNARDFNSIVSCY